MEAAAIEAVAESMISEEVSVVGIVNDEMELAMVSFVEGKCKCADEVTTLKIELLRCQSLIQELSTKLEQHLPPFCEESLKDDSTVNFYTGLTEVLTLQNQLGLCKPACAYLRSQKERTSSLQLRLRKPGQLLM